MEGCCLYIDDNNLSNILSYKELSNNTIFYVKYNLFEFNINYINLYDFIEIYSKNNYIYIINKLPYFYNNLELTLYIWKKMILNKLNFLNKFK